MSPEIIILPVNKSSCTETLWTPVMVTRVVLEALHYYAFCTIFFGRPFAQCTSDVTRSVLWYGHARQTHHLVNLFVSKSTTTSATDLLPHQGKARDGILFLDSGIYTTTYGYTGGSGGFAFIPRFFV